MLNIVRSTAYYCPIGISGDELDLQKIIYEIHLAHPYMGCRRIHTELVKLGKYVNRKRVIHLMVATGIGAAYPKQRSQINRIKIIPIYYVILIFSMQIKCGRSTSYIFR
ncbi:MAG: transposase [Psychrobium sp.]|nr:transposase [Psychrobium sp.]